MEKKTYETIVMTLERQAFLSFFLSFFFRHFLDTKVLKDLFGHTEKNNLFVIEKQPWDWAQFIEQEKIIAVQSSDNELKVRIWRDHISGCPAWLRIMPWNPQQMAINEMKKRIYDL